VSALARLGLSYRAPQHDRVYSRGNGQCTQECIPGMYTLVYIPSMVPVYIPSMVPVYIPSMVPLGGYPGIYTTLGGYPGIYTTLGSWTGYTLGS